MVVLRCYVPESNIAVWYVVVLVYWYVEMYWMYLVDGNSVVSGIITSEGTCVTCQLWLYGCWSGLS